MEGKLIFEAPTGCQEPGLLSVWKSLTSGHSETVWWFDLTDPDPRFYDSSTPLRPRITRKRSYTLFVPLRI